MDTRRRLHRTTCTLFVANVLFWLVIFLRSLPSVSGREKAPPLLVMLLAMEPVLFLVSFVGYLKRWKFVYIASTGFLAVNMLLSLTDEVGAVDLVSLGLSAALLVLLILQWRRIMDPKSIDRKVSL